MNEEKIFVKGLSRKAQLTSLGIEFRPRPNVDANRLADITATHKQLLLDHPGLKSLSIDMTNNLHHNYVNIAQLQPTERMPPIQFLSLTACHFHFGWQGLPINLEICFLQRLHLNKCKRLDVLFYHLRIRNAKLRELRLRLPIWREGAQTRDRQRSIFQRFLDSQTHLQILELDSLGFSDGILGRRIRDEPGEHLKVLELRDLDHQLRSTTKDFTLGRAAAFKSLAADDVRNFRLYCPALDTLHFDLWAWDFDAVIPDLYTFYRDRADDLCRILPLYRRPHNSSIFATFLSLPRYTSIA